jgi:hypothetical protein
VGKGSGAACFHLQGQTFQVSKKIILTRVPVFSPKTLPVEAVRFPAPEIGNDMFHLSTIYGHENKGMYQKGHNKQVDKDDGVGHCSRHRVQLPLFKGNITGMDGGRHRLFQGILPVHLQDRLLPAGCGDTFLHSQLSGILTIEQYGAMKSESYINCYFNLHNGAVLSGGSFCICTSMEKKITATENKKRRMKTEPLTDRELPGKVGKRSFSDGKVGPCRFRGKIILALLRYFSRKPCLTGSICRKALVVQRAAKARVFTIKKIKT